MASGSLLGLALLTPLPANSQTLTLNPKPVTLSAEQRTSLQRFVAGIHPERTFDWTSLEASSMRIDRKRQPLTVALRTVAALTAAGICRDERHSFRRDRATGRWRAHPALTSHHAWRPQGGECAVPASPITINATLSDAEFDSLERRQEALRGRAAGVIGGSDCARVRYCAVALSHIERRRQETPPRTLTRFTYFPTQPGPACLYVMELTFVGPLEDLVPLGARCPKP